MALRTDFKDDVFEENRKYRLIENDDGTVSFVDVTIYTQEGDVFGANDINETNAEVNRVANELGNKASSGHTHTASEINSGTLPVSRGGTGGTERKTAFKNLAFLGHEPIASITDDTMTNWGALGSGYATYSTLGLLNDQPNQYGFLINYTDGGVEVCQFWIVRPTGEIYVRGANGSGWNHSWAKVFDGSQTVPVKNGGTGATTFASGALLIGNGANAVGTRAITNNTGVANASGTNIPTCNTVNYHVREWLNRDVAVDAADTGYSAYRARGIALLTAVPSSMVNGTCAFIYG